MAKFIAELGLTPSSRSRLAIQVTTGPKPWEDPLREFLGDDDERHARSLDHLGEIAGRHPVPSRAVLEVKEQISGPAALGEYTMPI